MADSPFVAFLTERLAPYLGENMARAAIRAQAEKLGLADVGPAHLEPLLERLGPGLAVFIGREKTTALLAEIRAAASARARQNTSERASRPGK